jgi:hypothetical protein
MNPYMNKKETTNPTPPLGGDSEQLLVQVGFTAGFSYSYFYIQDCHHEPANISVTTKQIEADSQISLLLFSRFPKSTN